MPASYDSIASSYDFLSRIVFGRALMHAQEDLLHYITPGSTILIAGGGTGWILERIAAIHPQGLSIDYLEASGQMLRLSQQRRYGGNTVRFIHQRIEDLITEQKYDIIVTPFLFDNFKEDKAAQVFDRLASMQAPTGLWLYTDYITGNTLSLWQKLLLKTMYFFFRIISGVEADHMPGMDHHFAKHYTPVFRTTRYHGFITSIVYGRK